LVAGLSMEREDSIPAGNRLAVFFETVRIDTRYANTVTYGATVWEDQPSRNPDGFGGNTMRVLSLEAVCSESTTACQE